MYKNEQKKVNKSNPSWYNSKGEKEKTNETIFYKYTYHVHLTRNWNQKKN